MLVIQKPRNIPFRELASLDIHKLNQTLASDLSRFTSGTARQPHCAYARVYPSVELTQAKPLSMLIKLTSCSDKNRIRAIALAREAKSLQSFAK